MTSEDAEAGAAPTRRSRRGLGPLVACGALVALLALGEAALRVYHLVRQTPPDLIVRDERLGWRPTPDVSLVRALRDGAGAPYTARVTQDARGFRAAGPPARGARRRLLVVGDSFTQAIEADDQDLYYARLGRALDLEVFAVAGGGWGSLQECLALEEALGWVAPDLVLWQFCSNDLVNNDLELERGSCCNNNGVRRPYLDADGALQYATPKPLAWLWDLKPRSRLVRFFLDRWLRLPRWGACIEDEVAARGGDHPAFRRAVTTTRTIMARARRTAGDVPLIAFAADPREPHQGEFRAICAALDVEFVPGVAEAVAEARAAGRVVVAADGAHWSALGHEVVADALLPALRVHPALRPR